MLRRTDQQSRRVPVLMLTPARGAVVACQDLDAELCLAQGSLTEQQRGQLRADGVGGQILRWGWAGALPVLLEGDLWQPCEGEPLAFVVPVKAADGHTPENPNPENVLRYGDVVDLVAFRPDRPDRWALRLGAAAWLGAIEPQFLEPRPVRVWRTPLEWLRAGGEGIVPLSHDPEEVRGVLLWCRAIVAADVEHGRQLRRLLEKPARIPPIYVDRPEARVAA